MDNYYWNKNVFCETSRCFFYLGFFCLFSEGSVFLLNDVRSGVVKFSVANAYLNEDFEIDIVDVFKGVKVSY